LIPFTKEWFISKLIKIGQLNLEKTILTIPPIKQHVKITLPIVASSNQSIMIIFTNLNLHYVKKLSCQFEIFQLSGCEEYFYMTQRYFCIVVIISPWRRTRASI
jgi:hypothetical protein